MGFLSRFRSKNATDTGISNPEVAEQQANVGMPDKVAAGDLPASGNDVAIEELSLSHEGLTLDQSDPTAADGLAITDGTSQPAADASTKLGQFAINGNSPAEPDDGAAGIKYTLFQDDGTPLRASADAAAPEFNSALISETSLPKLDAMDSDQPAPPGPDEMSTLVPLTESKEMTGAFTYHSPDMAEQLDEPDDDPDVDDLT